MSAWHQRAHSLALNIGKPELMSIPKDTLDVAEAHPRVLEHFAKAVLGED
jgi:hypothetical protein